MAAELWYWFDIGILLPISLPLNSFERLDCKLEKIKKKSTSKKKSRRLVGVDIQM